MPEVTRRVQHRRAASRLLEAVSAAADQDGVMPQARRRWQELDFAQQFAIAELVASSRRADCTRSYRSVVQVAAGLRRRNSAQGREYLHREVCVVFIVRRKLSEGRLARRPQQRLPIELLSPACVDGRPCLVAVPTDVQRQERVIDGRALGASAICASLPGGATEHGSVACALATAGGASHALAPMHVLSPLPTDGGQGITPGVSITRVVRSTPPFDDQDVLVGSAFGGRVARAPVRSFDAQFAEIVDRSRLAAAMKGLRLSATRPFVRDMHDLATRLADGRTMGIHVPSNHLRRRKDQTPPLAAVLSLGEIDFTLDYDFRDGPGPVLHQALELQVLFGDATMSGDSGSPVLVGNDGGEAPSLVGMLIAGNPTRRVAFVIPAWRLLAAESYAVVGGSTPPGQWQLMSAP